MNIARQAGRGLYSLHAAKIVPMCRLLIITAALAISCSAAADTLQYPYVDIVVQPEFALVGEASSGCQEVLYKNRPAKAPQGFKVSPGEALALAIKAIEFDCSIKSQRYVRANTKYYQVMNVMMPSPGSLIYSEVIIDGMTGQVMKAKQFRWPQDNPASAVGTTQPSKN